MPKFDPKRHWHNLYFIINTLIWTGLILLLAFLFTKVFLRTGILLGACAAISVVSSAVLLRPGRRLLTGLVQIIAWGILILLTLLLYQNTLIPVLVLFLPAAFLSMGTLALLASLSLRSERELKSAVKRG
jgi:hypothetical protein